MATETKVIQNAGRKANLVIACGIGDFISYLARLESFKQKHDVIDVHFQLVGGWKDVPNLIKEISIPAIQKGIITSIDGYPEFGADVEEDWRPDKSTLKYNITIPTIIPTLKEDETFKSSLAEKTCIINPVTSSGNGEGFIPNRYLSVDGWICICEKLKELGYRIVSVGGKSDVSYLPKGLVDEDLIGKTTIRECIYLITNCQMLVGCNSWPWEVSAYAGIPTLCQYYTNFSIFGPIHFTNMERPSHGIRNLRIDIDKDVPQMLKYIDELDKIGRTE